MRRSIFYANRFDSPSAGQNQSALQVNKKKGSITDNLPDIDELTKNKWLAIGAIGGGLLLLKSGKGLLAFGAGVAAGYYGKQYINQVYKAVRNDN